MSHVDHAKYNLLCNLSYYKYTQRHLGFCEISESRNMAIIESRNISDFSGKGFLISKIAKLN